jgi:hypothetical protein
MNMNKLIDENGKYIDPMNRSADGESPEVVGADLAHRVIHKTAKEEILPKKAYRVYMPIGDASVALSDGRQYSFVNDECNVLGKHLDEILSMGARRIKQDRGQADRVFGDENK